MSMFDLVTGGPVIVHPSMTAPVVANSGERGALDSLEKAYESLSEQKDLYGFLMDFS